MSPEDQLGHQSAAGLLGELPELVSPPELPELPELVSPPELLELLSPPEDESDADAPSEPLVLDGSLVPLSLLRP